MQSGYGLPIGGVPATKNAVKGASTSVHAAHGAGKKTSRTRANELVSDKQFTDEVKKFGVTLLGGGVDESPFAYKDIQEVMKRQEALLEKVGRFFPKILKKIDAAQKRRMKEKNKGAEE